MEKQLQSFHRRCARYTTGQHICLNADGAWTSPAAEDVPTKVGLVPIQEYILRQIN